MKFNPIQKIYLICDTGALGDTISTFPILKLLAEKKQIERLFVSDRYVDLHKLVLPHEIILPMAEVMKTVPREEVTPDIPSSVIDPRTGEAKFLDYPLLPNIPVIHSMSPHGLRPIRASLVDSFSATIAQTILKEDEKDYPFVPKEKLPSNPLEGKKYAVIAYGATSDNRKMTVESFRAIKEYLLAKGYEVVLLGKRDHELSLYAGGPLIKPDFSKLDTEGCIDYIDKTSIVESLSILNGAALIAGVDGGLLHLAGMTDIPIVAGYTMVDPYYREIYRFGKRGYKFFAVEPDSECRFCQTNLLLTYGISFHACGSRTFECVTSLTSDKWITQIDRALNL